MVNGYLAGRYFLTDFIQLTIQKIVLNLFRRVLFFKMMVFECYRYFISGLFADDSRSKFLDSIKKAEKLRFNDKSYNLFYEFLAIKENFILGRLVKKSKAILHPDETLHEKEFTDYSASYIVVNTNQDINKDVDSQTLYIQSNNKFYKDNLIPLNAFIKQISHDIAINPINIEVVFWEAIKKHVVRKLTLEVEPPNLFGHKDEMVNEVKEARDKYKAKKLITSIETDENEGLDLANPSDDLKDGLGYCMAGGGSVRAIGKDGKTTIFDSKDKISITKKKIEISSEINQENKGFYLEIINQFFKS